jgi:hypothetical protein
VAHFRHCCDGACRHRFRRLHRLGDDCDHAYVSCSYLCRRAFLKRRPTGTSVCFGYIPACPLVSHDPSTLMVVYGDSVNVKVHTWRQSLLRRSGHADTVYVLAQRAKRFFQPFRRVRTIPRGIPARSSRIDGMKPLSSASLATNSDCPAPSSRMATPPTAKFVCSSPMMLR